MEAVDSEVAKQTSMTLRFAPSRANTLTLLSIGIVAYALGAMLHEAVGHGGACFVSGGRPIVLSTVHMECSSETRLVAAGGTFVNFVATALFWVFGRLTPRSSAHLRFFFWLSMTINLFAGTGYFLFSGIGGFGDWATFIKGLGPQWPLRIGLAIIGGTSYVLAARLSLIEMRPLIGSDKEQRISRAAFLMRIPYFTGGVLACIAGALNPAGRYLIALSAAASTFGGTSGLVWMHHWLKDTQAIPLGSEPDPPPLSRSWPWIFGAACVALVFIFAIGPGVRFGQTSHPK
jgi:hypothetical protein